MCCVEVPKTINQITSLFYRLGFWHRGEEPTVRETRLKLFLFIYYLLFVVSLVIGSMQTDNRDESIFLLQIAIDCMLVLVKLFYIIWRKEQILELLNGICVYSVNDHENFNLVNSKLKLFTKFIYFLFVPPIFGCAYMVFIIPFIGSEKRLFLSIAFPWDWKNDEIAFWLAFTFFATETFLAVMVALFSPIVWFLMMSCGLKYVVLSNQIRKMGEIELFDAKGKPRKISNEEKSNKFQADLVNAVQLHDRIREEITQMLAFFAPLFLVQFATSSICITGSIYSVLFSISENVMEYMVCLVVLFYNIFEIFMVMHFGNEIKFSSDRLAYCVFKSDWCEQPEMIKKNLIIFAEMIKQPCVLVVGKLYALTLETFTKVLNSAYSFFNILKNLK